MVMRSHSTVERPKERTKMAKGSPVIIDLEPESDLDAENRTTSELISMLRYCFRDRDFAKAEAILTARELRLKQELETTEKVNEWLKEKLEFSGMEKIRIENELKKYEREYQELSQEKNAIYERERKAKNEIEVWKRKYEGLESRILKLEADLKMLSGVEPDARVSNENGHNIEVENAFVRTDVAEENVDLARANMGHDVEVSRRSPSRRIVRIFESNDDCASGDILSRNEMPSQRVVNGDHSGQTGAQLGTGMLKRKQDSCLNGSENKYSDNDGFEDEDVYDNALTVDCKIAKVQKLIHGHDGSAINHCSKIAASSRSNSVEKFCGPSRQDPVILRQWEEMGAGHASENIMREFPFDVPGVCDIDDSSSSSSSSDSDVDMDFDFSQLVGNINDKKWESETDMLAAFVKDNELYLKALCALYRQQTTVGKSPRNLSSSTNRGFNHVNATRGTALAKFLIDGDPQGRLKKSISELQQHDPKGLDDCKKIAFDHSKQLFEIYQKKEDPLFMS